MWWWDWPLHQWCPHLLVSGRKNWPTQFGRWQHVEQAYGELNIFACWYKMSRWWRATWNPMKSLECRYYWNKHKTTHLFKGSYSLLFSRNTSSWIIDSCWKVLFLWALSTRLTWMKPEEADTIWHARHSQPHSTKADSLLRNNPHLAGNSAVFFQSGRVAMSYREKLNTNS